MNKKYIEAITKYINSMMDPTVRLNAAVAVASACVEVNPRFDFQKFYKACGV